MTESERRRDNGIEGRYPDGMINDETQVYIQMKPFNNRNFEDLFSPFYQSQSGRFT